LQQDAIAVHASVTNVDFDFSAYSNMVLLVEIRVIGATREGTGTLVDSFYAPAFCVVNNKAGTLVFGNRSLGLPATPVNPMVTADSNTPIREPCTTDTGLRSGGGSAIIVDPALPAGTTFRVHVNNQAPANDCPCTVYLTIWPRLAP
jgi:hypothetical protein